MKLDMKGNMLQMVLFLFVFCTKANNAIVIEGWVYVDNWFELYFNGEKISSDPLTFKPQNAVKISFDAPTSGIYSYVIYARDYANDITGLEYNDTCLGDGGIRISLSDGTISNDEWKCFIEMEGPTNPIECGITNDCTTTGSLCTVQYNELPLCWNETICNDSNWITAIEYSEIDMGWIDKTSKNGKNAKYECGDIECVSPRDIDWNEYGESTFIWTDDLDYHNRIVCRYQYYAQSLLSTQLNIDLEMDTQETNIYIIIGIVSIIVISILSGIVLYRNCNFDEHTKKHDGKTYTTQQII